LDPAAPQLANLARIAGKRARETWRSGAARPGTRVAVSLRMHAPTTPAPGPGAPPQPGKGYCQSLLYRWFVEYNPLYLLSAALVLGGCVVLSSGLADHDSLSETIGVALIAEVYAASLLGGVALLTRIGMRRPAVMLALLSILYQWDTTLHTETCAYLGAAGAFATAAWLAIFVGKLFALGWALRVRFARRALAAATLAAVGLAFGPRLLPELGARGAGAALAAWAFALGALYDEGAITSLVELTPWGRVVLRRATRAAWLLSAALVAVHVAVWQRDHAISVASVLPALPLLGLRRVRSEARAWALSAGTLVTVALAMPGALSVAALLLAAALVLRALSPRFAPAAAVRNAAQAPAQPYRAGGVAFAAQTPEAVAPERASVASAERARAWAGAAFALHLAAWTVPWTGGAGPPHVLALDVALTLAVALLVWRARAHASLVPLGVCYLHFVVQARLVPAPRTTVEWGASAVALGFVLLAGSLAASYRLRPRAIDTGA
jgi:hypothetical protein